MKEPCESWTAWSIDIFIKKPLVWSFSKVKSYVGNNEINRETKYIHLQIVKEFGNVLLSILERKREHILVSFSELAKSCKSEIDKNISDNNIMLISEIFEKYLIIIGNVLMFPLFDASVVI